MPGGGRLLAPAGGVLQQRLGLSDGQPALLRFSQEDAEGPFFIEIIFFPLVEDTVDVLQHHPGRESLLDPVGAVPDHRKVQSTRRLRFDLGADRGEEGKNKNHQDQGRQNGRHPLPET